MGTNAHAKNISLALAVVIVLLYAVVAVPTDWHSLGIYAHCPLVQRLIYSFFHASWFHVLVNAWCLVAIAFVYDISITNLALSFIIAFTVPSLLLSSVPTVGLSAVLYALCGLSSARAKNKLLFHAWFIAFIAIGFVFRSTNGMIHLYAYAVGCIVGLLTTPLCLKK